MGIGAVGGGNSMISSLLMKALDQDKSGTASLAEFTSVSQSLEAGSFDQSEDALAKAFSSLDSDQDGSLTESEIAQGLAKFSSDSAGALLGAQEAGGPPPPPPGGAGGPGRGFFAEADADGSGSVSLNEFTAAGPKSASSDEVENLFSQIDSNGDGEISSTEDEAFRSAQGPQGPGGAGGPAPPPPSGDASDMSDDSDDETDQLVASLSELLNAQGTYGASATSFLDEAISSLFKATA